MTTPIFAEEAVLGGLMLDNDRYHDIGTVLAANHFTSEHRSAIFSEIKQRITSGEAADVITLSEAFPHWHEFLWDLHATTAGGSMVGEYAKIVRSNWRRREAASIGQRLVAGARNAEEGVEEAAIAALMALGSTVTECEYTGKQAMKMAMAMVQAAYEAGGQLPGITTGLQALDDILGGFHDSDLTIIGARPAMGKTALMGSLAEAAADKGKRPGVISAEQPAVQMALRRASMISGVSATRMRAGKVDDEDWARMTQGIRAANSRDMWIYDRSAVTLDELVGVARKWKHTHDIGILYIDYAQRIRVPGVERITEVSEVARGMKNLARDLNIPVVALAQVKAAVDTRPDKRPTQGDLANSDELTREADQILMLYRDCVYSKDPNCNRTIAEILIEKNRHGPTGFKRVHFAEETMRFGDLTNEQF